MTSHDVLYQPPDPAIGAPEHWTAIVDGARRAYLTYQELIMATTESPFQRWWAASVALCRTAATDIIDRTAAPERNRATGGVDAIIAAAEPGAEVAPGVTREMAEEMAALWDWFNDVAQQPLADERAHGKTPVQILSELGGA